MKKKVIALMLAAAMVVGVTACGGSSAEPAPTPGIDDASETTEGGEAPADDTGADSTAPAASGEGKVLSVQIGPNPETIDPALNSAVDGGNMILHTFECL